MTTETLRRDIQSFDADRFRIQQAQLETAALAGELGLDAQLLAMSEQYKALKAEGKLEAAAAVKAEAQRLAGA